MRDFVVEMVLVSAGRLMQRSGIKLRGWVLLDVEADGVGGAGFEVENSVGSLGGSVGGQQWRWRRLLFNFKYKTAHTQHTTTHTTYTTYTNIHQQC